MKDNKNIEREKRKDRVRENCPKVTMASGSYVQEEMCQRMSVSQRKYNRKELYLKRTIFKRNRRQRKCVQQELCVQVELLCSKATKDKKALRPRGNVSKILTPLVKY